MSPIQDIDAIYENGVIRPIHPIKGISEHSRVKVRIASVVSSSPHTIAECIGTISKEDANQMSRTIKEEFEKVDLREWQ